MLFVRFMLLFPTIFGVKSVSKTNSLLHANGLARTAREDGPLRFWRPDKFVRCIFCMNYDDYNNLSSFGCELRRVATCVGNICYMRQHKRPEYFLYTSGCLNLTRQELAGITGQIVAQTEQNQQIGNETQLCEVGSTVNTCICANRSRCNNVTSVEPFIEYGEAIFANVNFDELAHFRHLLPNDPMLEEFERERSTGDSYYLVRDHAATSYSYAFLTTTISAFSSIILFKILS